MFPIETKLVLAARRKPLPVTWHEKNDIQNAIINKETISNCVLASEDINI
jgi:hypothetical protein